MDKTKNLQIKKNQFKCTHVSINVLNLNFFIEEFYNDWNEKEIFI